MPVFVVAFAVVVAVVSGAVVVSVAVVWMSLAQSRPPPHKIPTTIGVRAPSSSSVSVMSGPPVGTTK